MRKGAQVLNIACPSLIRPDPHTLAHLAVQSLASPHSRRMYSSAISRFLASGLPLNREGLQTHVNALREANLGAGSRNTALSAIKLLAREGNARGMIPDTELAAIERVRSARTQGVRMGHWLDAREIGILIEAAGRGPNGVRNRALVALMVGCGLRRAEVCALDWSQYQRREQRYLLVDIRGKGDKVRTVPVPHWAVEYLAKWREQSDGIVE